MIQTVDGAAAFETTIENLMPSTTYLVEVAAINSDGTGVYSDPPTSQLTRGELLHIVHNQRHGKWRAIVPLAPCFLCLCTVSSVLCS